MSKKFILPALVAVFSTLVLVSAANAQYTGPQGEAVITTVGAILEKPQDDQAVTLRGYLVQKLDQDDKYIFSDTTGKISVEIDEDDFKGQAVNEKTHVQLSGEVDKDLIGDPEVDVEHVTIITE
ncbi:MAG: hypothetical protein CMH30_04770 [Micavibrio sp.]|nr:hypothetical protein [Micavibrio sp.]